MFARTRSVLPIAGGTPAALSTGLPGLDACLPGVGGRPVSLWKSFALAMRRLRLIW